MTKRIKQLMVTLMAAMMFFTSVPSTVMAAPYSYNNEDGQRNLDIRNGKTLFSVNGKEYELTKALVSKDAGCSKDGTVWIEFKNSAIYWWNYDLQGENITLHKYTAGASLNFEGDYVVSLQDSTGEKMELLSLEEQRKLLGIEEPTEPGQPEQPSQPTPAPTQPTEPSQPTPAPTQPAKPSQPTTAPTQPTKPSQPTTTPTPAPTTNKPSQSTTGKTDTKKPTTKKKTTTVKAGKVVHKGRTYYVYSTKGKILTKFSLTKKGGKFSWRGYTMRGVTYVAMVKKSKNVIVLTKKTGYVFNYSTMKRTKLYNVQKYGKPIKIEYDNNGFGVKVVTKKPRRFSIKNK